MVGKRTTQESAKLLIEAMQETSTAVLFEAALEAQRRLRFGYLKPRSYEVIMVRLRALGYREES